MAVVKLKLKKKAKFKCLDINYLVILINRFFFSRAYLDLAVKIIISLVIMRELGFNVYKTSKYIITPLCFLSENIIIMIAPREIYIINNLKVNILIDINIMILK